MRKVRDRMTRDIRGWERVGGFKEGFKEELGEESMRWGKFQVEASRQEGICCFQGLAIRSVVVAGWGGQ